MFWGITLMLVWRSRNIVIRSDNHDETECCDLGTVSVLMWLNDVCVCVCGCAGAAGVWFGPEQASWGMWSWSQANLWEREAGSCLPVCHASICASQFTPSLPISAAALGHSMRSAAPQGQGLPVCNPVHLRCKGKDHPTYTIMSFTSAEPLDIISLTNAPNKYNMNFTYL